MTRPLRCPLEHAIVRHGVVFAAVGVVQREGDGAVDFVRIEVSDQLFERLRHAVLVEAEVRMGVDARRRTRQLVDQRIHPREHSRNIVCKLHSGSLPGVQI